MAKLPEQNKKDQILQRDIAQELRESYLDYSMSVIVARALPDVRDGLKPVQRRILYQMHELGLTHGAKTRKSSKIVGDVMGNYHPHGNMAIYDALARLAQDFSLRYPLIDGQGNFGSIDGDPPAAERYTEARMTGIAEELLRDIDKDTVDFVDNYDATRKEPKVLPAALPQLLLNGTSGIAVGMATSVPPHNLSEVCDAAILLVDKPKAVDDELAEIIQGPDFPTGGIIFDKKSIKEVYRSGKGGILSRGVADIQESGKDLKIIITQLPYQVNKAELIAKIAELSLAKKLEGIKDVRDESDKEGLRIVVDLKQNASPQKILNRLYKFTELEKMFYLNLLALDQGIQPKIFSLRELLGAFLGHRQEVITRRTKFDLQRAKERAHILEGLKKALDNIDAVIKTIKTSKDKDDARINLIKKFSLTEIQATAILQMQLQTLAALERSKIEAELEEKRKLVKELTLILKEPKKILDLVKKELTETKQKYGDERRTKVKAAAPGEISEEDLIPQENVLISISGSSYIKRMPLTSLRSQKRGGRGVIGMTLKEEDLLGHFLIANSHDRILFFSDRGRVFQTKAWEIPEGTRQSQGKLIQSFLDIPKEEKIQTVLQLSKETEKAKKFMVLVTEKGVAKKMKLEDFQNIRRSGIIAANLKANDSLRAAFLTSGNADILISTKNGMSLRFKEKDLRPMGRTASGVRGIRLRGNDLVIDADALDKESAKAELLVVSSKGYAKKSKVADYRLAHRGGVGVKTLKVTDKTGRVSLAKVLADEAQELFVASNKGQAIRTKISEIPLLSRSTQGVRIMRLEAGEEIKSAAVV